MSLYPLKEEKEDGASKTLKFQERKRLQEEKVRLCRTKTKGCNLIKFYHIG